MTNKLLPFQGETMTCLSCGKKEKSNPAFSSNWTTLDVDDVRVYFCPSCFGNDKESTAGGPKMKRCMLLAGSYVESLRGGK